MARISSLVPWQEPAPAPQVRPQHVLCKVLPALKDSPGVSRVLGSGLQGESSQAHQSCGHTLPAQISPLSNLALVITGVMTGRVTAISAGRVGNISQFGFVLLTQQEKTAIST